MRSISEVRCAPRTNSKDLLCEIVVVQLPVQLRMAVLLMDSINYSEARAQLARTMDKVCDDHAPIVITRKSAQSVVLMSLEDFQALEETAYLLRSPKNARRLLESIAELESGEGSNRELAN